MAVAPPPEGPMEVHLCSFTLHKTAPRLPLKAQRCEAIGLLSPGAGAFTKLREADFKRERQNINGANYWAEKQPPLHGGRASLPS